MCIYISVDDNPTYQQLTMVNLRKKQPKTKPNSTS